MMSFIVLLKKRNYIFFALLHSIDYRICRPALVHHALHFLHERRDVAGDAGLDGPLDAAAVNAVPMTASPAIKPPNGDIPSLMFFFIRLSFKSGLPSILGRNRKST
jgi:hypothetical protein